MWCPGLNQGQLYSGVKHLISEHTLCNPTFMPYFGEKAKCLELTPPGLYSDYSWQFLGDQVYMVPEIELGLTVCKASALVTVLSFYLSLAIFFFF